MVSKDIFFVIPTAPDGACLFSSIRIAMEINYAVKKIKLNDPPKSLIIDGYNHKMLEAGQRARFKIVEWFRKHLDKPIPQLGNFVEGKYARPWTRGDLLATEMVCKGRDIEESGPERKKAMAEYLLEMSNKRTWGSTPEYTAAACMTGKTFRIWQKHVEPEGKTTIIMISEIKGSTNDTKENNDCGDNEYNLLFSGNHYQPLLTADQMNILKSTFTENRILKIVKPLIFN